MPRSLSPAMQARSTFVGRYIKERHHGGTIPRSLFKEAHAAFAREHPEHIRSASTEIMRANPWKRGEYEEEVSSAAVGTVIGLTVFAFIGAAIIAGVKRAQGVFAPMNAPVVATLPPAAPPPTVSN